MTWDTGRTVEYYDSVAEVYDERGYCLVGPDYPANYFRLQLAAKLLDRLPPGRILDASCGTGLLLAQIAQREHECAGFDFSRGMLERARQNLGPELAKKVPLVQTPAHDLSAFETHRSTMSSAWECSRTSLRSSSTRHIGSCAAS